ncbi:C-type lectin domain family 4 member G-like [Nelusetta ayraudi]|uniref:C-type lectin domain family 4 member G-like n=1 Tax=Nelusetta ayraudi TaxID=303726 RepID=UPI003F726108
MHQMGVSDYINEPPGSENADSRVRYKTERKLYRLLFLSVGILCTIQAALNVSLRLVNTATLTVASQRCASDWREVNFSCYFLSTAAETWEISRKRCQSKGADLAVIKGQQEQRALYRLDGDAGLWFWIGLRNNTRTFQWVDGSALKKSFWSDQSVDSDGPHSSEACVVMNHTAPLLANWDITPCGLKRRWLCEKSLN